MPETQGYRLEVNLRIAPADPMYNRDGLEVRDALVLPPMGFLELAAVLGRFHELAEQLRAAHATKDGV